jgi:hypothetical protein
MCIHPALLRMFVLCFFSFNDPCQFTQLLNFRSLIFGWKPSGWLRFMPLNPNFWWDCRCWIRNNLFRPNFSGKQLGRKTRVGYIIMPLIIFWHKFWVSVAQSMNIIPWKHHTLIVFPYIQYFGKLRRGTCWRCGILCARNPVVSIQFSLVVLYNIHKRNIPTTRNQHLDFSFMTITNAPLQRNTHLAFPLIRIINEPLLLVMWFSYRHRRQT